MDAVRVSLVVGVLKVLAFACDVLTFPFYVLWQRPWKTQALSRRIKAVPIAKDADSVTYRSTLRMGQIHKDLISNNVDTMAKLFEYGCKKFADKRCLGTRPIISEEEEEQQNDKKILKKYVLGDYKWKSYLEVNVLAEQFGLGMRELGNEARQNVAIFAETREEWMIAAQGLFKQNIPLVTVYVTLGDKAIAHTLNETEVKTVITSHELMPKFKNLLEMVPHVQTLIYMEDQLKKNPSYAFKPGVNIISYNEVLRLGEKSQKATEGPTPGDTAVIMYTSGSAGIPKGVVKLHKNLIAALRAYTDAITIYDDDVMIGYLPLAHTFEMIGETICLLTGISIGYSSALTMVDSSSKIRQGTKGDASVLRPTYMCTVPLILGRISKSIEEKVNKGGFLKRALFRFAYEYKVSWQRRSIAYKTPLIDRLVFGQIRNILGGRLRIIVAGGAPLLAETHEFINTCLCATIMQGYGLTETTSCGTLQDHYDQHFGRVGPPITACDFKLVNWIEGNYRVTDKPYPRGEALIGGDITSAGYYKLHNQTAEYYIEDSDGKRWFRTGDICEIHHDGVVKIIDRKKDLVKLQMGEYVSLGKVEAHMKTSLLVENICVYGESTKNYCVALVVPNAQQLESLAKRNGIHGLSLEQMCRSARVEQVLGQELMEHGKAGKLEKFEIPKAFKLVTEIWTPDNGLVTAALKLKRINIVEHYRHLINEMYND